MVFKGPRTFCFWRLLYRLQWSLKTVSPNSARVQSNSDVYVGRDILVSAALNGSETRGAGQSWGGGVACAHVLAVTGGGVPVSGGGRSMQITHIVASLPEFNLTSLSEPNFTSRGRCGTRLHSSFCELVVQGGPVYIYYTGKVFLRAVGP